METKAILALSDGTVLHGHSFGVQGTAVGELVFNTAMTGYQEILTDPSYADQIVTLTYPHIGNTGCNEEDMESSKSFVKGLIIRNQPTRVSNHRSELPIDAFLKQQKILAAYGFDTRFLTQKLRTEGAFNVCLSTELDGESAIAQAKAFKGLLNSNLAKVVSTKSQYKLTTHHSSRPLTVVAYDFGIKKSILNHLERVGFNVTVVPYGTLADEVIKLNPDAIFLSNGPGDPAACTEALESINELLKTKLPMFGICLGFQLLALSLGATSYKMKFGHHGANHPVQVLNGSKEVFISSQNHGFAIEESSLPQGAVITHRSLFDGSLQGFKYKNVMGFQGHPEAGPGPHDLSSLFDEFYQLCLD